MLFNSFEFVFFLPLVLSVYWWLGKDRRLLQNGWLLMASYVFYGWWDWRFLSLIVISSTADFWIGKWMYESKSARSKKRLLYASLLINLGILGFFKYFNFFVDSVADLFQVLGLPFHTYSLSIILPVGISFYTFQSLSYTIDIYKGKLKPTSDGLAFFTFVCFFPQLVAGPIERAAKLLPQFESKRSFSYALAADGFRQFLWGLFKKVAIADVLANNADIIFSTSNEMGGGMVLLGCFLFAFQIYCDFSGYSDMAIGIAKWFGFRLSVNFRHPYFARNLRRFWQGWHITLSQWFRDYVYIPLGGNRRSKVRQQFNLMLTFLVSGLWHGANWTFLIWGAIHGGVYILQDTILGGKKASKSSNLGIHFLQWSSTFLVVIIAWLFFRAESLNQAMHLFLCIFNEENYSEGFSLLDQSFLQKGIFFIVLLMGIEFFQGNRDHALEISSFPFWVRWAVYYLLFFGVLYFFQTERPFIYFAF